jgi:ADP-ribose pyrophosphatase YjhB (NUDIX family)
MTQIIVPSSVSKTESFGDVLDLGDGMIARRVWHIEPKNADILNKDVMAKGQASNLNTKWDPKTRGGQSYYGPGYNGQWQRCPSNWVDNIILFLDPVDGILKLLFGEWNKEVDVYGNRERIHGLALAGGGHYERMGKRPSEFLEGGDMSLISCADKELFEETKIPREACKKTFAVGLVDDVFNDPRTHGIRFVYLRYVTGFSPQATDELKKLVAIPLPMVKQICEQKSQISVYEGKPPLGIILNHDKFLLRLFKLPDVQEFINKAQAGWPENVVQPSGITTF